MTHPTDRAMEWQPSTRPHARRRLLTSALALAGLVTAQFSAWISLPQPAQAAPPQRAAPLAPQAPQATGTWTQTEWITPSATLSVQPSGSSQFFRPTTAGFGVLTGTFGVCAGSGMWCRGPGDSAPGQTLRLAGNWRTDAGNPWSSDLNGDGISELLFANWWMSNTFTFNGGWIYWGQGSPTSPSWSATHSTTLPTAGVHGIAVADLNGNGLPEVIFANYYNGITSVLSSYIYWGQAGGPYGVTYTPAVSTALPPVSGAHAVAVADLNSDGRPEIIFASYQTLNRIYWGQAGGPHGVTYTPDFSTTLPVDQSSVAVAIADLNRDSRPEIIFAARNNQTIYWGQAGGPYGVTYAPAFSTTLPQGGFVRGNAIADLNNDGRPEIISTQGVSPANFLYWGQAGGPYGVTYTTTARTTLPAIGAHKASIADLNNDGQRDVVLQDYEGGFTRVFWGPLPTGGTATISWTLPITFGFRGLSLSDLNGDGRVDLLTGRQGTAPDTSGPFPYPYWVGGTSGRVYLHTGNNAAPYNTTPSFDLPVLSSPGAYASFGPGRGTNGDWFSQPRPVYGTAFPGFGVLESQVMDSGQNGSGWIQAAASTQIAAGTGITLFVAASDNLSALNNPTWTQVGAIGNGSWSQTFASVVGRYARYRVILWRDATTEASPALQDITFTYATQPGSFSKSAPADGATGQPTNPTLSWGAASGVNHYRYCYATTTGCVPATSVGTNTSVALSGLTPGTTYYWQVRACGDPNCTVFTDANGGAHWSFTVVWQAYLPIVLK